MAKHFQLNDPLLRKIELSAAKHDRTLAEEINMRLEQSFLWDAVREMAKVQLGMVKNGKIHWEMVANPQIDNDIAGWAPPLK